METLQPASWWRRFVSALFPKSLTVQVRTETLPSGEVQVVPVFLLDGQQVPDGLVGADPVQKILGHTVCLDHQCRDVVASTQGQRVRLSKKKAAEFLERFSRSGVMVRSRDGKVPPRIDEVRPNVDLVLHADDTLAVHSELVTADGVIVEKPPNLDRLRQDEGWYVLGDNLVKVVTTDTALDEVLLPREAPGALTFEKVPQFLQLIERHRPALGDVDKDPALQPLTVFGAKTENQAVIDGDADAISVTPHLIIHSPTGRTYAMSPEEVARLEQKPGSFERVADGWIEVRPDVLDRHRQACQELTAKVGRCDKIEGSTIPRVLSALDQATHRDGGWSTPWTVYFSESVRNSHRVVDVPARLEFPLNIVESDGGSLLALDPIYHHERFRVSQTEAEDTSAGDEKWIRRRNA